MEQNDASQSANSPGTIRNKQEHKLKTYPAAPVTMAFLWWSLPMPKLFMVWTLPLLLRELLAVVSPILSMKVECTPKEMF